MNTRLEEFLALVIGVTEAAGSDLRRELERANVPIDGDVLRTEAVMTGAALVARAIGESALHIGDALRELARLMPNAPPPASPFGVGDTLGRCTKLSAAGLQCEHFDLAHYVHVAGELLWADTGLPLRRCLIHRNQVTRCQSSDGHEGPHHAAGMRWSDDERERASTTPRTRVERVEPRVCGELEPPPAVSSDTRNSRACQLLSGHAGAHLFSARGRA